MTLEEMLKAERERAIDDYRRPFLEKRQRSETKLQQHSADTTDNDEMENSCPSTPQGTDKTILLASPDSAGNTGTTDAGINAGNMREIQG